MIVGNTIVKNGLFFVVELIFDSYRSYHCSTAIRSSFKAILYTRLWSDRIDPFSRMIDATIVDILI